MNRCERIEWTSVRRGELHNSVNIHYPSSNGAATNHHEALVSELSAFLRSVSPDITVTVQPRSINTRTIVDVRYPAWFCHNYSGGCGSGYSGYDRHAYYRGSHHRHYGRTGGRGGQYYSSPEPQQQQQSQGTRTHTFVFDSKSPTHIVISDSVDQANSNVTNVFLLLLFSSLHSLTLCDFFFRRTRT